MTVMIMIITIFVGNTVMARYPLRKSCSYEVDERDVSVEGEEYSYILLSI